MSESIVDRFNCEDVDDLLAYKVLMRYGIWPEGYIGDATIPPQWQATLAMKIAEHFVNDKIEEMREIGWI